MTSNDNLYRWVKASERLPEDKAEVFYRNGQFKLVGFYDNGVWYDDTHYPYLTKDDAANEIEWLEKAEADQQEKCVCAHYYDFFAPNDSGNVVCKKCGKIL